MLEKEEKRGAIQKHMSRKEKTTIIPPTCSGMIGYNFVSLLGHTLKSI